MYCDVHSQLCLNKLDNHCRSGPSQKYAGLQESLPSTSLATSRVFCASVVPLPTEGCRRTRESPETSSMLDLCLLGPVNVLLDNVLWRMLKELRWPSLQSRRDVLTCCQVYKIIHKLDYTDFSHCFSFTPLSHSRFHNLTLFCKPSRINVYRHCFFISFPMPTPTTHLSQSNISSFL